MDAETARTKATKRVVALEGDSPENTRGSPALKRKVGRSEVSDSVKLARGRHYHHGNLREDLVRCGKKQLREVGLAELTLRRIASETGVSQAAPKHHFGNKEGLLAAIAASGFRDLTEFRFSRLRANMTPERRLRTLLSSYVAFAILNPTLFQLMFAPQFKEPETRAELDEAASQSFHVVARAAADYLAARGKDDEDKNDPNSFARVAWMCMHGVATLIIENRINPFGATKVNQEQLTEQTLDMLFAGTQGPAR
ncbi:TetR/AcrR family transcriptional regulator [Paraburkholderia caribensis]|uniref:TetR/AcrR family transcriptional regulator n=1 Tax=Paraburkholderia caribensis TaxID=75105 RepID=UPI001CAD6EFB|nr:TetR/AcrR family transcriptional regulator [Paraburkholderia caribensis]CAG9249350.1 HTH tetR-type domain-containing protein [Paraburkholderia caribensis]